MSKAFSTLILLLSLSQALYAQQSPEDSTSEAAIADRLVRLALKNSSDYDIAKHNIKIADSNIKLSRRSWYENFGITGNLNEFVLNPPSDSSIAARSAFYPKYNVSGRLSIGTFLNIPIRTRIEKEKYAIAQSELKTQGSAIKLKVLQLYEQYKLNEKLLRIQTEILGDLQATYTVYERKFKDEEISFEEYNKVLINYNQLRLEVSTLESRVKSTAIAIESMIGIPLEEAIY